MSMKATIVIDGLRIRARHGVLPQERVVGNEFEVSLSLVYPPALEATSVIVSMIRSTMPKQWKLSGV